GGIDRDPLGEDAIDHQAQLRMLLGAADREDGAVVLLHVVLHLHPVHVMDSHGTSLLTLLAAAWRKVAGWLARIPSSIGSSSCSISRGSGVCRYSKALAPARSRSTARFEPLA